MNIFLTCLMILFATYAQAQSREQQEIILASEAAPDHISNEASFMIFDGGEFHYIKKGSNNFTCMVIREPKGRFEPACLNREAMASVFPTYEMHMKLMYEAGLSMEETLQALARAHQQGQIPNATTGSLVYMMSPNNKVYDYRRQALVSSPVHQMYFYPKLNDETFSLEPGSVFLWQGYPHLSALIVVLNRDDPTAGPN